MNNFKSVVRINYWLSNYNAGLFIRDLIAGFTLAAFVLPESMAYSSLAGLPTHLGIYCCITGGLLFALFTSSRQLVVGPTSAISLMVGTSAALLSGGDPSKWLAIASLTALSVFALSIFAYLLKLSSLVNFISESILVGFKTGAALSIASTQLPKLFGVGVTGNNFFERIFALFQQLGQSNYFVLIFGLIAFSLLIIGNKILPGRPVVLIIVIFSILFVTFFPSINSPLQVVGQIPEGLPRISFPSISFTDLDSIFSLALGCFIVGYIETISAARAIAEKHGYEVDARQELLSMGAANLATAFTSGYPVSGGLSQSTVNDRAGAKTPFAILICSIILSLILLKFTGLLRNLPEVILAVIVLDAIIGLVKVKELKRIYTLSKPEFIVAVIAIAGVLIFGILKGVLIAAAGSLVIILIRASSPKIAVLGRIPNTNMFSDIERHSDNEMVSGCLIFRVETSIFYFNQQNIHHRLKEMIIEKHGKLKLVILDMSSSPRVDISGSQMLVKLSKELEEQGITLRIVEALSDVRELLRLQGMETIIGHISRKVSILDVINEFEKKSNV